MRSVGRFAFSAPTSKPEEQISLARVCEVIRAWLEEKGSISQDLKTLYYSDGRTASLTTREISSRSGKAASWELSEPTVGGQFITTLSAGQSDSEIVFSCTLAAGNPENIVAPVPVEARCPQVIRTIVDLPLGWRVGTTAVRTTPLLLRSKQGGQELVSLLCKVDRALPVIVVAQYSGLVLHPGISTCLARDLTGLAVVAEIDDEASWEVTRTLGKDWSCYNGAVRLYWPTLDLNGSSYAHPLWTSQRLLYRVPNTEEAAQRIRNQLRRRLFGISAFTIETPELIEQIEQSHFLEESAARRKTAEDSADYQQLADEYARENEGLRAELAREKALVRQLRQDLYSAQVRSEWEDTTEISPNLETPPETVEEAVERARRLYAQQLTFGNDVGRGVRGLARDAGPPDKVFAYLEVLSNLATAKRDGELGTSMVQWLSGQGFEASRESETIRNSREQMQRRRWHDGRSDREFEYHLKPSDATSPDHCVRIYFDWDEPSAKIVVGWVGRHP